MSENINLELNSLDANIQSWNWVNDISWQVLLVIALLIFAIVFIIIFKKDVSGWIQRWKRIRGKNFDIDSSLEPTKEKEIEPVNKEEQAPPEDKTINKPEGPKEPQQGELQTLEDWRGEMFFALINRDIKRADNAYKKIHELNTDPISTKEDTIMYFRLLYTTGDPDAINSIRSFLSDADVSYKANMALGHSYTYSHDFVSAKDYFSKSLTLARTEEEKTYSIENISKSLYQITKKQEAFKILYDTLPTVSEDKNKASLYETLAELYEKEKDYENSAFVLDKAIEIKPNDSDLLFKAGYSYAESGFEDISLLHYSNAKSVDPKNDAVQNNLGVLYEGMNMPIKSINSYREAENLGNTLASANLGYRLISTGFISEAKSILNSAAQKDDVHSNVNSALAEIQNKIDDENNTEQQKNVSAQQYRRFFLDYISAKLTNNQALKLVSGEYKSEDGNKYQVNVAGQKIIATWIEHSISYDYEWKLEGEITNNSSTLEVYEEEYNRTLQKEFIKKGKGYLFCTPDGKIINFVWVKKINDTKSIITIKK